MFDVDDWGDGLDQQEALLEAIDQHRPYSEYWARLEFAAYVRRINEPWS